MKEDEKYQISSIEIPENINENELESEEIADE